MNGIYRIELEGADKEGVPSETKMENIKLLGRKRKLATRKILIFKLWGEKTTNCDDIKAEEWNLLSANGVCLDSFRLASVLVPSPLSVISVVRTCSRVQGVTN